MKASNLAACALATAVAALPMAAGAVTAEVNGAAYHAVAPVAVTAQDTFAGDDRAPIHAIDGSGMSPQSADVHSIKETSAYSVHYTWLNNNTAGTWIAFDLGEEREVSGFHLWNYNDASWTAFGIRTAGIYVGTAMPANGDAYESAGEAWGTLVKEMTFAQAPGNASYTGDDYFFDEPVRGRYFQFKISDNFDTTYDFAGISEIVFYERVANVEVTRLASGAKSIAGLTNGTVSVVEGTSGAAAPIALGGATVRAASIRTVAGGAYGGTPQIDLGGGTLVVDSIDLPAGAAGLELSPGFLTCWEGAYLWDRRNWMKLNAEEDLTLHASLAANKNGLVNVSKTGAGTLTVDGTNSCVGTLAVEAGALHVAGGATKVETLSFAGNAVSVDGGGVLGFGEVSNGAQAFSLSVDGGTLAPPLPAPMIHYDFNTVVNGRVPNLGSGGAAYDGVVNGAPPTVDGVTGNALDFSMNGRGVATASEVPVKFYTFAAWVKSAGLRTSGNWQRIVIAETEYAGYLGTDGTGTNFTAFVRTWDDDPNDRFGNSADTENWHHVAMTYDGSAMKCYLDGVLVVEKPLALPVKEYSMKLGIGNNAVITEANKVEYWNGAIDEVYVFDHALSGGEVAILKERSGKMAGTWIPQHGTVRAGPNGVTFDSAGDSLTVEGDVIRSDGAPLRKTGANALTLKTRVEGAGPVNVEEGTLTLALALASSPLIHYDFDNVAGGKVPNLGSGGAAYDGVVSGSPATVDGVAGNALDFSAANRAVTTASDVPLRFYTFAAWVKSNGALQNVWQRIVIAGPGEEPVGYLGSHGDGLQFTAFVRQWDNDQKDFFGNSADTENWHHVAMTYDGSTMKCYLDGALVVEKPLELPIQDYSVKIGIGNDTDATKRNQYWNGAIDEVYVFDRAVSADEVVALRDMSLKTENVFDPASDLSIASGAVLDLRGTDQTVASLTLGGRLQRKGKTTWGAIGSGAEHETPMITGGGILRVKGPSNGFLLIVR